MSNRKYIYVNYDNEKSIIDAEKLKALYEKKGYTLIETETALNTATLTYTTKTDT